MLTVHWATLLFLAVIEAVGFFILGAMDGVALDPEANFAPEPVRYTPEEDAYWAEYIKALPRQGRQ